MEIDARDRYFVAMRHTLYVTLLAVSACEPRVIVEGATTTATGSGTEPSGTEPSGTEPSSTEPSSTEPSSTEPSSTEPSSTAPTTTAVSVTEASETGTSSSSTSPTGSETGSSVQVEIIRGAVFETDCIPNDLKCGARAVCEAVTGSPCEEQNYDCQFGEAGTSFFPMGGQGKDVFNFGAYLAGADTGNICACDPSFFQMFNIPQIFMACAEGGWRFVE